MKELFKPHIESLNRVQTSLGRDCQDGIFLDRNERVVDFPDNLLKDLYNQLPKSVLRVYPETDSLYKTLSQFLGIDETQIFLTFGSTGGIKVLFETLTNPGDTVFTLYPTYPMYEIYSEIFQTKFNHIPIKDFRIDIGNLINNIDEKAKLVFIANPNLPVETYLTLQEIEYIAKKCEKTNTVLVVDEAYSLFGGDSVIDLIDKYKYLVVLRSFSKAFGLAGIRLGYMASKSENIEYLSKTRSLVETNGLSLAIADYILKNQDLTNNYVKSVKDGTQYLKKAFTKIGVQFHGGEFSNGMIVFLKSPKIANTLISELKKQKIYIRGGFSHPYDCCVRVTLGPIQIMEKLFNAFKKCLNEI